MTKLLCSAKNKMQKHRIKFTKVTARVRVTGLQRLMHSIAIDFQHVQLAFRPWSNKLMMSYWSSGEAIMMSCWSSGEAISLFG